MANTKVTGDVIANGTISTVHLADDAITAAKLDSTATGITFADLTVDTDTLYVDATNNRVGIGTTSPGSPLDIQSSENVLITATSTDAGAKIKLSDSDSNVFIQNQSNTLSLGFSSTQSGQILHISSNGNVGIGTTSPDSIVEIVGNNPVLTIRDSDTSTSTATSTIRFAESNAGDTLGNYWDIGYSPVNLLGFDFNGSTKMTINSSGNVGIGTTSPANKLSVCDSNGTGLEIAPNDSNAQVVLLAYDRADSAYREMNFNASNYIWRTSATERMRIDSSGNTTFAGTTKQTGIEVEGTSPQILFDETDVTANWRNRVSGGSWRLQYASNGSSFSDQFVVGATNTSFETGATFAGDVGIGETSPSTKVEIKQTNNDIYQLTLYNNHVSTTSKARIGNWNDEIKISSNYMQSGGTKTQDNTAKSSWVMSMGAAGDAFDISRSPAASTTLSSLMKIDSSGNVGINETDPSGYWGQANNIVIDTSGNGGMTIKSTTSGNGRLVFTDTKSTTAGNTDGGMIHYKHSDDEMRFQTNGSQKMVIDSSGNVGINETNPAVPLHISRDSASGENIALLLDNNDTTAGNEIGILFRSMVGSANTDFEIFGKANGANDMDLVFQSDGSTERMRITSDGEVLINKESARGSEYLGIESSGNEFCNFQKTNGSRAFRVNCTDSEGFNTSGTTIFVGKNGTTNRSINAGGTINASGADYAEYMNKAIEEDISKGDIVGVNSNGELTNIFNDSVSFVVKSTNPSYVGGDTWGVNLEGDALEEARLKVDRIAFSGQVPCNVYGASVGDYIIPINNNGKISAQAISNPTFDEYKLSVGKVWKIMEDGRAWIAVKIV